MMQARLGKRAGDFALDIELQAAAGISVLFGESGAGKTLALDLLAGFVRPDSGRILLDDAILFDAAAQVHLPPRRRPCGYVQSGGALFPHLTLRQNLMFAAAPLPRLERHRRSGEMLERFELKDAGGAFPAQVSLEERQRCALARALVVPPKILFVDAPADSLECFRSLRGVEEEYRIPLLVATAELETCFELADEMFVLSAGRIVQSGAPRKVLDQPANAEVARLLGATNLFEAEILTLDPGRNLSRVRIGEHELNGPYFPGHFRGDRVRLSVRAEDLQVHSGITRPEANQIPAELLRVSALPRCMRLEFSGGITVETTREQYQRHSDNKSWLVEIPATCLRVV